MYIYIIEIQKTSLSKIDKQQENAGDPEFNLKFF